MKDSKTNIRDLPELRDCIRVFDDRGKAGEALASMLTDLAGSDAVILAIPDGGVPVGAVLARRLGLPLEVAVVSKITPAWNTEVGFGAVAWDGTTTYSSDLISQMDISSQEVDARTAAAREKVRRRVSLFCGGREMIDLAGRTAIVVDDGLATGSTMRCAIKALRPRTGKIIVAVPTAHGQSLEEIAAEVNEAYCPNVRWGWSFAVAEAYKFWTDVSEQEVAAVIAKLKRERSGGAF